MREGGTQVDGTGGFVCGNIGHREAERVVTGARSEGGCQMGVFEDWAGRGRGRRRPQR